MSEEEKEKMMQKYEETVPREGLERKMTDSVVGRKTIDKLVDERKFEKEYVRGRLG